MSYTATIWSSGDIITTTKINNLEIAYKEAVKLSSQLDLGGGDWSAFNNNTAFPSGAGYDKLLPNTGVIRLDPIEFSGGSFQLEVTAKVDNILGVPTVALFDLTGAPDTALTNSSIVLGSSLTGVRGRSSTITLPATGTVRELGLKGRVNSPYSYAVWAPKLMRIS